MMLSKKSSASRTIESALRERLKSEFDTTLPRFDVMAALWRVPDGMLMSDLSKFLLVSNGNVTVIVDRLVADGFVRRTSMVRLTPKGTRTFAAMAAAHEDWVNALLRDIGGAEARQLAARLEHFSSNWES